MTQFVGYQENSAKQSTPPASNTYAVRLVPSFLVRRRGGRRPPAGVTSGRTAIGVVTAMVLNSLVNY